MQYLVSVIHDAPDLATPDEMAAIDVFNDRLQGLALLVLPLEADEIKQLENARADPLLVPAEQPRHGGDVLADGHVREQAALLDHIADAAPELDH